MAAYLEIQVSQDTFLLPLALTQEVLNISAGLVVPVANMPSSILGLLNHRNSVYWTLDLGKALGLSPLGNLAKYAVTILSVEDAVIAIAAETINGIQKRSEPILPRLDAAPNLLPYLKGCIDDSWVLNPEALLNSVNS
jgi:positive phototaxis protein PixI